MKNVQAAELHGLRQVCAVSKYIIKYGRGERVKYISHLDFMRCFHRAIRRSPLQFEFSQGFNPHPIMTVAQPLSVGVTSECEYMKVGFDGDYDDDFVVSALNEAMPDGFTVYAAKRTDSKEYDITKLDRAVYIVEIEYSGSFDADKFMSNGELKVMKKSKSGVKESDIRPHIFDIKALSEKDGIMTVEMCVSVGSAYNLKPESVVEAMEKYSENFKSTFISVHRKKMTCGDREYL